MSHDRGCYKCGRDRWDYDACEDPACPKKPVDDGRKAAKMGKIDRWYYGIKYTSSDDCSGPNAPAGPAGPAITTAASRQTLPQPYFTRKEGDVWERAPVHQHSVMVTLPNGKQLSWDEINGVRPWVFDPNTCQREPLRLVIGAEAVEGKTAKTVDYRYAEGQIIADFHKYIDATYGEHYTTGDLQAFDAWIALGDSMPTFRNTALKYLWRYGKKEGNNKKDLMKVLHYVLLMLYVDHYKVKK